MKLNFVTVFKKCKINEQSIRKNFIRYEELVRNQESMDLKVMEANQKIALLLNFLNLNKMSHSSAFSKSK